MQGRCGEGGRVASLRTFFNMYCFRSHLELSRSKILSVIEDLINVLWLSKI